MDKTLSVFVDLTIRSLPKRRCRYAAAATRRDWESCAAPNGARRRSSAPKNMRIPISERLSYTRLAIEKK